MTAKTDLSSAFHISSQVDAIEQAMQILTTSADAMVNIEISAPGFAAVRVLNIPASSLLLKGTLQSQHDQMKAQLASLGVT